MGEENAMNNSISIETNNHPDLAERAKKALEQVCSGQALDQASQYYSEKFIDHVNNLHFEGREGVRKSVGLYTKVLSDLEFRVEEQLTDGDRVTSRFVVSGKCFGKQVRFNGITISRFSNDRIVEDWSVTDTLSMLRQLGAWRSLFLALRYGKTPRGE
jgi:predicted ester cyclase